MKKFEPSFILHHQLRTLNTNTNISFIADQEYPGKMGELMDT